jgi:hypothetical protein
MGQIWKEAVKPLLSQFLGTCIYELMEATENYRDMNLGLV